MGQQGRYGFNGGKEAVMESPMALSLHEKLRKLSEMSDACEEPDGKENIILGSTQSYPGSPHIDKIRAAKPSRRGSKAGSLFDALSVSTSEAENAQEYITQRFTQIEDYLDSLTEDFTQDLEREQQHLILMQEQVDMQGQILHREVTAMNKKLDGETTRRSFVSSEVKGTKEAMAEQLEKQSQELADLRARLSELETPYLVRSLRRAITSWLSACTPWSGDLLTIVSSQDDQRLPSHVGDCAPSSENVMDR